MKDLKVKKEKCAKAIGLIEMQNKVYDNFEQFWGDVKWFIHYCLTVCKKKGVYYASSQLLTYVNEEIQSILACEDCYNNAYVHGESSFIMPCKVPHLLLWAQPEGYGYWPAKAMTVNVETHFVNVRFFSDHTTANLSEDRCYLYSKQCPDSTSSTHIGLESYQLAIKVSCTHLSPCHIF